MSPSPSTAFLTSAAAGSAAIAYRLPGVRWSTAGVLIGVRRQIDPAQGVALSFDDGPAEGSTERVLRVLERHSVHATFFLQGEQVQAHPEIAREIAAQGHEIGCHGFTHRNQRSLAPWSVVKEMRTCREEIAWATGTRPRLFRPPYGDANLTGHLVAHCLDMEFVLWSRDAADWQPETTGATIAARFSGAQPGDILLLHDAGHNGRRTSDVAMLDGLDRSLATLLEQGTPVGPIGRAKP